MASEQRPIGHCRVMEMASEQRPKPLSSHGMRQPSSPKQAPSATSSAAEDEARIARTLRSDGD